MTKETIVDPISNSELPIKDVLEQLAKSINNAGIPKELFVTIPGEEGLPTQYGGKYILAKQKWLNRECWINAGTTPAIHGIFYNPDLTNWCIQSISLWYQQIDFNYCLILPSRFHPPFLHKHCFDVVHGMVTSFILLYQSLLGRLL